MKRVDSPQSLSELATALQSGEQSALALVEKSLSSIRGGDAAINAVIRLTEDRARASAQASDQRRREGRSLGPLDGVPIAVKGLIALKEIETDAGSAILRGFRPLSDATAVQRLEAAGAVVVAQTNLDEFGMGSATRTSIHGASSNPWDPTRTPGGSSGGSAAAVAAGFVPLALGTDTGGSIRQPASLCGIAGLKPTYGRVSRRGLFAFASSLDQIGPMAARVEDLVPAFLAMAGHDAGDASSAPVPLPTQASCEAASFAGLRIGVPSSLVSEGLSQETRECFEASLAYFQSEGATLTEIALPHASLGVACYYVLAPAEASSNLSRYDGVRFGARSDCSESLSAMIQASRSEGFGAEVKRRILLGTFVLSTGYYDAYYGRAQRVRECIRRDFAEAFLACDLIVTPTSPTPAWRKDEMQEDPLAMYLADIFTVPASLAGLPAISLPAGFSGEGLPIGLQMIAPTYEEARLLSLGTRFERDHDFVRLAPASSQGQAQAPLPSGEGLK